MDWLAKASCCMLSCAHKPHRSTLCSPLCMPEIISTACCLLQAPMTEARQSDVVEDDGEVVVRMSTGNWYFLREDPANRKAFILEGGSGERFQLQTDKPVGSQLAPEGANLFHLSLHC